MAVASVIPVSYLQYSCFCQDILVPFILDVRLPDDTIFWVMEEDFRFWPPGDDPDNADNYDKELLALLESRAAASSGGAGSSLPPSQDTAQAEAAPKRVETEYHTALTQGCSDEADEDQGFCQDVIDMMRIATMCHRHNMGERSFGSVGSQRSKVHHALDMAAPA